MLIASGLLATACRKETRVLAVVLAAKGDVTQLGSAPRTLQPGSMMATPSAIRTAADSAAVIATLPGVIVRLEEDGELSIERLELRKRVDEMVSRSVQLDLRRGRSLIWVDEFRHGAVDLQIHTAAGELRVRGPVFADLALEADGQLRIICISGSVRAGETALSMGQWVTLSAGERAPAVQSAADVDGVWKALLRAREVEPQLIELQGRQRERTPVRGLYELPSSPKN